MNGLLVALCRDAVTFPIDNDGKHVLMTLQLPCPVSILNGIAVRCRFN